MSDVHPVEETNGFFKGILKKIGRKKEDDVTEEEIMDMVNEGHEQGVLAENEAEMINNIFEFADRQASDVMIHRKNIIAIDCETTVNEAFEFILGENYSRYPVYESDIDNVIGILHLRDLLKVYVDEANRDKTIKEVRHQLLFDTTYIPETLNLSVLFKEMQSKKTHMAVVVDEYGQTSGLVTLEDVLEEIVGDILDEYDDEEVLISKRDDGSYILDGQTPLEEIEELFDIHFDCEDIDTINGYIMYRMGKIPSENETFSCVCDGCEFKVLEVSDKMITKVRAMKEQTLEA
jgi:putative hemolysin